MTAITKAPHSRRRFLQATAAALILAGAPLASPAQAQTAWPNGPVQLIVPAGAGGGTDAAARIMAEHLQSTLGVPFVVVNAPGGGGAVAAEQVRAAAPDGQTLMFFHSGLLSTYHTGGYQHDPLTVFNTAAVLPVGGSYALAVQASSPWQTMDDLVQASIAAPNSIALGIQMRGSTHFMAGLLAQDSGARFRLVEAGGDADKLVQLSGGQIGAALINTPGTIQYVESGALRILGTISGNPERDPGAPDYPSMAELGYTNTVYGLDFLIMGPSGMPDDIATAINAAVNEAINDPVVAERYVTMRFPLTGMDLESGRARLAALSEQVRATAQQLGLN